MQMLCRSNQINGDDNQTTLWYLSIHFHLLHNVFVFLFFLWEAGYVARTSSSLQQHSPPPGTIPRHPRAKWDISSLLCALGLPPDHLPAGHPPGGVPEGSPIRLAEPPQLAQHTATLVLSSSRTSPPLYVSPSLSKWRLFWPLVSFDLIVSLTTVGESCDVGTSINDC